MDHTQRLFFALWPQESVRNDIASLLASIPLPVGARRMSVANLHLTLIFIGSINVKLRPCLERAAAGVHSDCFTLMLEQIGYWREPRVAWLAPEHESPALTSLVWNLECALAACNFIPEARPYRPHITLARNVKNYSAERIISPVNWKVEDFSLVESRTEAEGVRYYVLDSWALSGNGK